MYILLYVKPMWCSGIPQVYGGLEGLPMPQVYMHSAICETYLVQWYSTNLWSIGGGGPWYMSILLYGKLIWCSGIPQIYGELEKRYICHKQICHSAISETYLMYWYSIDLWSSGGDGPWYMCILLYVQLMWCSGISQIYAHMEGDASALGICVFC